MSIPRRHHFVARSYLERFGRDGRVRVRRRDQSKSFVASAEKVAVQTGFYDLPSPSGEEVAHVEEALAEVDEAAIDCLRRVDDNPEVPAPGSDDRRALAGVMGLQLTRTPEQRERILFPIRVAEYAGDRPITPSLVAEFLETEHLGFEPDDNEVHAALDYVQVLLRNRESINREFILRMMFETATQLAQRLLAMTWRLELARKPHLITSDLPVVMWRPPSPRDRFEGIGIQSAEEVRYPLDPGKQLVLRHEPSNLSARIEPDRVRACNADMGRACHNFIVGHPDRSSDLYRFQLPASRPVIRFSKGPLYVKGPNGESVRHEREVLHMWVPRR